MKRTMDFIVAYFDAHGYAPTLQEIADELGMAAKSNANQIIARLVERGWLIRHHARPRGIEIVRRPGDPPPPAPEPAFGWLDPAARRPGVIVVHVNAQGEEQAVHVFPDLASAADGLSRMP